MKTYKAIGLMSGTSLDGLDVCHVTFTNNTAHWSYIIDAAETYPYPDNIRQALLDAPDMSAYNFICFSKQYGQYIGQTVNAFSKTYQCSPDLIASHGHTIFHQPHKQLTYQIGDGAAIAAETRLPVVCDFRSLDVALGGQGAPLVPIGDRLLFADYTYCLNIGGFANISFDRNEQRIAYDVCPANIVLNHYAQQAGKFYDDGGAIAASGNLCTPLLDALNGLPFYADNRPKSLGREWVEATIIPLIESYNLSVADTLHTLCQHAAQQIARNAPHGRMLVTGGGAFNTFLINAIKQHSPCEIVIPNALTINFKEALIFAFLGVLYTLRQPNCLASATGAPYDSVGGAMYNPA